MNDLNMLDNVLLDEVGKVAEKHLREGAEGYKVVNVFMSVLLYHVLLFGGGAEELDKIASFYSEASQVFKDGGELLLDGTEIK